MTLRHSAPFRRPVAGRDRRGRVRSVGRVVATGVVAIGCAVGTLAWSSAGPAGAAPDSLRATAPPSAGLEQSWTGPAGTWAVVAMGHYGQRSNTFWQVLFRPVGKARWTLVTPPGVASNGGFSFAGLSETAGGVGSAAAGFQPSEGLTYSPVAVTDDDGKSWSAGTLPSALLAVADAVAESPAGVVYALVRPDGGTLVRSEGSLTTWKPVATRTTLAASAAGRGCDVTALTAVVAGGAGSSPELGAACARRGVIGLFRETPAGWAATTVPLRGDARSTFTVLRLQRSSSGTSAIVEARDQQGASLVALWRRTPSSGWTGSPPVRLHGTVLATTSTGSTSLLVLTGRGFDAQRLLWVRGPGATWRSLGDLPRGTEEVTAAPGAAAEAVAAPASSGTGAGGPGELSALVVSGSKVRVWQRTGGGGWHRTAQRFTVPIEYGSST